MIRHRAPGLSIAIASGSERHSEAFGVSDANSNTRCDPSTRFCVGSITKQFTAAAILQLVEAGHFTLETDIAAVLPDTSATGIRVRHLLSHTAGFALEAEMALLAATSVDSYIKTVLTTLIADRPGMKWRYSNAGFVIAGKLIELSSGVSYSEYLQNFLFGVAGLTCTTVGRPMGRVAQGHAPVGSSFGYVTPCSEVASFASGSVYSTPRDLIHWSNALASGSVISHSSFAAMMTPALLSTGEPCNYGLGMFVSHFGEQLEISQDGHCDGFSAQLARYPLRDLTVAVITNSSCHDAEWVEKTITRGLLDVPDDVVLDLELSGERLSEITGTYEGAGQLVRIWGENGRLSIRTPTGTIDRLLCQSPDRFLQAETRDVCIQFRNDGAVVSRNGKLLAVLEKLSASDP